MSRLSQWLSSFGAFVVLSLCFSAQAQKLRLCSELREQACAGPVLVQKVSTPNEAFNKAKKLLIEQVNSRVYPIYQFQRQIWSQSVSAVTLNVGDHSFCEDSSKNAKFDPYTYQVLVCRQFIKHYPDESVQVFIMAHELAHAIDPVQSEILRLSQLPTGQNLMSFLRAYSNGEQCPTPQDVSSPSSGLRFAPYTILIGDDFLKSISDKSVDSFEKILTGRIQRTQKSLSRNEIEKKRIKENIDMMLMASITSEAILAAHIYSRIEFVLALYAHECHSGDISKIRNDIANIARLGDKAGEFPKNKLYEATSDWWARRVLEVYTEEAVSISGPAAGANILMHVSQTFCRSSAWSSVSHHLLSWMGMEQHEPVQQRQADLFTPKIKELIWCEEESESKGALRE